jgi:hypothetical protein
MKARFWIPSVLMVIGITFGGTFQAHALSDTEQVAQVLSNVDQATQARDVDAVLANYHADYAIADKDGKITVRLADAQRNMGILFQKLRAVRQSSHIDQLEFRDQRDRIAIAVVTTTDDIEQWYDDAHTIFTPIHMVTTQKDLFIKTDEGWKLLICMPLSTVEKTVGNPEGVNGPLSAQQIADLNSNAELPWLVYSHNFINQMLIDQMMSNMR